MRVLRLDECLSTQDEARAQPLWTAVVCAHQSAGRGRLDRSWEAPPGTALLASFVLPYRALAGFAAGVAAAEAAATSARLKWPNDLELAGRKLGGILVENHGPTSIVGVGINLAWAPPGAAKLQEPREAVLERLCAALERWFAASDEEVLEAWRQRSSTLGRMVRAELAGGGQVVGVAEDLDRDGALLVAGQRVVVADLFHLRVEPAT